MSPAELRAQHVRRALRVRHLLRLGRLAEYRGLYVETVKLMESMAARFQMPNIEVPDRILFKLDRLYDAKTEDDALLCAKRACQSMEVHLLALWARGLVPGPNDYI